jgi:2-polyprenyl-3-methyl-5-hydroxy-6-metoxy-1,4-benzoquinol methylase
LKEKVMSDLPSPFTAPQLYELIFDGLEFDIPFWIATGLAAEGRVLEVGCGTGRILLPLLEAGVDADGIDLFEPMLECARRKAAA